MEMMLAILMRIVFFLILIGVVVFVHELGHFLLARAVGVTVVRFSLGFGKRLFGFTRGGTEFVVSAVPLGDTASSSGTIRNRICRKKKNGAASLRPISGAGH